MSIKGKAAIVGYGETEFLKRNPGDRSNYTEYCRAAKLAIEDAGLTKDDIDGLISIYPLDEEPTWTEDLQEYLQLHPRFLDNVYRGGAGGRSLQQYPDCRRQRHGSQAHLRIRAGDRNRV